MINNKYIIYWLNLSLLLVISMIAIGGATRLTQSGLSIVTWKPVTGIFPPINSDQWKIEFNKYKKFPEYINKNMNLTLTEYKTIYYWEYFHRLLGRIIGLFFIIPFIYFNYKLHSYEDIVYIHINNVIFLRRFK